MPKPHSEHQPPSTAIVYDIVVQLAVVSGWADGLEDLAVAIETALDQRAGDAVLAVSVTGLHGPDALEVGLDIAATQSSELYAYMADVLRIIESCGVTFVNQATSVEPSGDAAELALA